MTRASKSNGEHYETRPPVVLWAEEEPETWTQWQISDRRNRIDSEIFPHKARRWSGIRADSFSRGRLRRSAAAQPPVSNGAEARPRGRSFSHVEDNVSQMQFVVRTAECREVRSPIVTSEHMKHAVGSFLDSGKALLLRQTSFPRDRSHYTQPSEDTSTAPRSLISSHDEFQLVDHEKHSLSPLSFDASSPAGEKTVNRRVS